MQQTNRKYELAKKQIIQNEGDLMKDCFLQALGFLLCFVLIIGCRSEGTQNDPVIKDQGPIPFIVTQAGLEMRETILTNEGEILFQQIIFDAQAASVTLKALPQKMVTLPLSEEEIRITQGILKAARRCAAEGELAACPLIAYWPEVFVGNGRERIEARGCFSPSLLCDELAVQAAVDYLTHVIRRLEPFVIEEQSP